ncbi:hypothetical protein M301_1722 [Methylotenera versatilis 301]|uniref:Uncharacterized protein n=2 Tax=Methylotenera TaxID=359407 RepID=D7DJ67_METV0|nr:hypothetical protein M301_1722 [Methylotenera versatilis 301]
MLMTALLVTLWLTWQSSKHEQSIEISQPTRVLNTVQTDDKKLVSNNTKLILKNRDLPDSSENLFSTPIKALHQASNAAFTAPKPVAPPLPFKYLGRMLVGTGSGVMLNVQGEVMPIQQGDVLLGLYKVQAIYENAGSLEIQFLYLPLNQMQTLSAQTGS